MTRMSIIGDHFSLINLVLVKSCIMTTWALTIWTTFSVVRETFTV
jgi:hypothetical protein